MSEQTETSIERPGWKDDVVASAKKNYIWLNAFTCIRPSVEDRLALADVILQWLADPKITIESELSHCPTIGPVMPRVLVLSVVKS